MNQISKSECRNPNKLERQINLELGKSKTPNLNQVCFESRVFRPFELVSNFGSFDLAQDRFRSSSFWFSLFARAIPRRCLTIGSYSQYSVHSIDSAKKLVDNHSRIERIVT